MNARGTRRPHKTRAYKKPRKTSGGSPGKGAGCVVLVLILLAVPAVATWLAGVVT